MGERIEGCIVPGAKGKGQRAKGTTRLHRHTGEICCSSLPLLLVVESIILRGGILDFLIYSTEGPLFWPTGPSPPGRAGPRGPPRGTLYCHPRSLPPPVRLSRQEGSGAEGSGAEGYSVRDSTTYRTWQRSGYSAVSSDTDASPVQALVDHD